MNDHSSPSSNASSASISIPRSRLFTICGLLLLASAINYMDRQTLASVSKRITDEFQLSEQQYGNLEASFSWSFAIGSLFFGVLADRFSIRWLYPSVLFLWSGVGFMTGFAESYEQLIWCRGLLGLFEAAHWPCALKTTQSLLHARSRAMGNSVLQSGTSIGAILKVSGVSFTKAIEAILLDAIRRSERPKTNKRSTKSAANKSTQLVK